MLTVRARDEMTVETDNGQIVAYTATREYRSKRDWFVAYGLSDELRRAVSSAIFSLSGEPSSADMARQINSILSANAPT